MTHEREMIRWAKCPDDTCVWYRPAKGDEWSLLRTPAFHKEMDYVADDEFAGIRKKFIDGVEIQQNIQWSNNCPESFTRGWRDYNPADSDMINGFHNGTKTIYRVKPEVVLMYQFAYKTSGMKKWGISSGHYKNKKDLIEHFLACNKEIVDSLIVMGSVKEKEIQS